MKFEDKVIDRLDQLIEQADSLKKSDGRGHVLNATQY